MFPDLLLDDAAFLLRWLHVIAAMVWVGSAFALVRLDLAMRPRAEGGAPQSLLLNAGASFRFLRTAEADAGRAAAALQVRGLRDLDQRLRAGLHDFLRRNRAST